MRNSGKIGPTLIWHGIESRLESEWNRIEFEWMVQLVHMSNWSNGSSCSSVCWNFERQLPVRIQSVNCLELIIHCFYGRNMIRNSINYGWRRNRPIRVGEATKIFPSIGSWARYFKWSGTQLSEIGASPMSIKGTMPKQKKLAAKNNGTIGMLPSTLTFFWLGLDLG